MIRQRRMRSGAEAPAKPTYREYDIIMQLHDIVFPVA